LELIFNRAGTPPEKFGRNSGRMYVHTKILVG